MPRKRKAASDDGQAGNGETKVGHNSEITDEQRQALFFSHKRQYEVALAKKKETDAAFKNTCKQAKAELGDDAVASIKDAILLDSEAGEAKLRASIERQLRVARWMNVPFGQQADLFTDVSDPRPATERAHDEGKTAGTKGEALKPPYAHGLPQFDAYVAGWHEGQQALFAIKKPPPGSALPIGDAPPSHQVL